MYFLDTNTIIYFLKGIHLSVLNEFNNHSPSEIKIPAIVKAELLYGIEKSAQKKRNHEIYENFIAPFETVSFDDTACEHYAKLRVKLEKNGTPIGPNDLIIASIVASRKGILITHNTKEFENVPGLFIEDWVHN